MNKKASANSESKPPVQDSKKERFQDGIQKDKEKPKIPDSAHIVHRSREGLKLIRSFKETLVCSQEVLLADTSATTNLIENTFSSEDGELLAWCDNNYIKCIKIETQEVVFEKVNTCKSNCVYISPKSTLLVSYNTMSGGDNLHFWDINSGDLQLSMPFKKATQWKPVFSMNEDICLQHVQSQLILYVGGKFDSPKQRISHIKVDDFSLSTASLHDSTYQHSYSRRIKNKTHYVAVYTAGVKAQPSIVKIYKYPNLTDAITNKSFFKADRVKFSWSPSGNSLLITCQTDFDKSGKSYYGEQSLNFLNVKGDSYFVKLPKEGSISHLKWHPSCDTDMFICVYGAMPAKVSLFNDKCEVLHNFADEAKGPLYNTATFSPFGNLLAIYGIGNLAGHLTIWDFDKKKVLSNLKIPETTGLEWCADGRHVLTCTTAPRLRIGNGFRLWHYTGSLLHESVVKANERNLEIYDILWQSQPGKHKKPKLDSRAPQLPNLLDQSELKKFQGGGGKYVPPHLREVKKRSDVKQP